MKHKTFELIETKTNGGAGEFTALASVFGNVDHVGDRMLPGSFTKTLERWRAKGEPIPVILSHDWNDPMKYVGEADPQKVYETERGLVVEGKMHVGEGNPVADQVYRLMKGGLLKGWSFGYTVPAGGQKQNNGANEVSEVDLVEVGPTLKGANPEAQLSSIKSAVEQLEHPETSADTPAEEPPKAQAVEDREEDRKATRRQDPLRRAVDAELLEAARSYHPIPGGQNDQRRT